ncbi:MAG TPA: hypothetical protein VGJ19_01725, partial [Streptosporangiaceae bacterium]
SPFFVTAGTLTALAGLPRACVPGLELVRPPGQDPVSEPAGDDPAADLETAGATMVTIPWAIPELNGHAGSNGNGSHNGPGATVGSETGEDLAGLASPATEPSTNIDDGPAAEDPVPDVTGWMVELGAPAEPDGEPDREPDRERVREPDRERVREPVRVPMDRLRGGVLVAGCAGSGTARTVRQLLAQATEAGLPWLLASPAGADHQGLPAYRGLPATVIDPVDPDAVPLTFSPLALAPGCPLPAHLALAGSLLDLALGADERLSLLVTQALRQTYRGAGWDLVTGRPSGPVRLPDLRDLHGALRGLIARSGYDRATRARLRGTVDTRFEAWLDGPAGRFLTGGHPAGPADLSELLRRRVVLATRDLAAADRALVTGALLIRLAGHLRGQRAQRGQPPAGTGLRHLLVLDEARILLREDGDGRPGTRAAERFAALIPELAAAGVGTVLTERRPALLTPDVTRDLALRIVHRLPGRADRDAIGVTGGEPAPGTATVLADGAATPVRIAPGPAATEPEPEPEPPWPPHQRRSPACGRCCRAGAVRRRPGPGAARGGRGPGAAAHGGPAGGLRRGQRGTRVAGGRVVLATPVCQLFRRSVPAQPCC